MPSHYLSQLKSAGPLDQTSVKFEPKHNNFLHARKLLENEFKMSSAIWFRTQCINQLHQLGEGNTFSFKAMVVPSLPRLLVLMPGSLHCHNLCKCNIDDVRHVSSWLEGLFSNEWHCVVEKGYKKKINDVSWKFSMYWKGLLRLW